MYLPVEAVTAVTASVPTPVGRSRWTRLIPVSGLNVPEGPAVLPDGSWLVVEMGPDRSCVTHIPAGGERRELARTGRPNGLAVDSRGVICVAGSPQPALLRMTPDGACQPVVDRRGDELVLFANDLCFGPDRMLYLTDSGVRYPDWAPGAEVRDDYAEGLFVQEVWERVRATGRHQGRPSRADKRVDVSEATGRERGEGELVRYAGDGLALCRRAVQAQPVVVRSWPSPAGTHREED